MDIERGRDRKVKITSKSIAPFIRRCGLVSFSVGVGVAMLSYVAVLEMCVEST